MHLLKNQKETITVKGGYFDDEADRQDYYNKEYEKVGSEYAIAQIIVRAEIEFKHPLIRTICKRLSITSGRFEKFALIPKQHLSDPIRWENTDDVIVYIDVDAFHTMKVRRPLTDFLEFRFIKHGNPKQSNSWIAIIKKSAIEEIIFHRKL